MGNKEQGTERSFSNAEDVIKQARLGHIMVNAMGYDSTLENLLDSKLKEIEVRGPWTIQQPIVTVTLQQLRDAWDKIVAEGLTPTYSDASVTFKQFKVELGFK